MSTNTPVLVVLRHRMYDQSWETNCIRESVVLGSRNHLYQMFDKLWNYIVKLVVLDSAL